MTVAQLAIGQIRSRDAVAYVVFQLAGGVLAALLVLVLFNDVGASVNYGATAVDARVVPGGSPWLGLIAEAMGTFRADPVQARVVVGEDPAHQHLVRAQADARNQVGGREAGLLDLGYE